MTDTRADHRRARRRSASRARRAWVGALAALALLGAGLGVALPASAAPRTLVIDSLAESGRDAAPGDGTCATATDTCTLRAAIEESNALDGAAGEVQITVAPGLSGEIVTTMSPTSTSWMRTTAVTQWDVGAVFEITAPVDIDLDDRVAIYPASDYEGAAFHIDGPDVTLRNLTNVFGSGSSIVFGPNAQRVTVDGGSSVTRRNYFPERFAVYRAGASDITVSDYRLQGFFGGGEDTGLFLFNPQNARTPIRNIVIEGVTVDYITGGQCHAADGSGCRTNLTSFVPRTNTVLEGFRFADSTVRNLSGFDGFRFGRGTIADSVTLSDLEITGNTFQNVQGLAGDVNTSFITLPQKSITGTNRIAGNSFVRADSGQSYAIGWWNVQNPGAATASGLEITDNHFDGYSAASIRLLYTGRTTVAGNTFGMRSASQARPAIAEETTDGVALLDNYAATANEGLRTWFPTSAAKVLTSAPTGAALVASPPPSSSGAAMCAATVEVAAPSGAGTGLIASGPVDLELYWTADRTAELYLGRVEGVDGESARVTFSLPIGAQALPGTTGDVFATAVDSVSGAASGYIRVQTQAPTTPQTTSSQYSRIVPVSGHCRPTLTLEQAEGQNDPTTHRQVRYTLTASMPLDPTSLTPQDVHLTADATEHTSDAARINPRVTGAGEVAGSGGTVFEVYVEVDDSATVTAKLAAEAVTATSGLTNAAPATSTDPAVVFVNPVMASPQQFSIVTGDERGQDYVYLLRAGAPVPDAELAFALTRDQVGQTHGLQLTPENPTIAAGAEATRPVRVTAQAGAVEAGTRTAITATLRSSDPRYDGLVVPTVRPRLFATDPSIEIDKRAYTGVLDASSPERIEATGTVALSGARLQDAEPVCFVYTVTNRSRDDWATVLTDIVVTDSDTRLGQDGRIGEIARLGIGESTAVAACATLIPVDTTVSAGSATP